MTESARHIALIQAITGAYSDPEAANLGCNLPDLMKYWLHFAEWLPNFKPIEFVRPVYPALLRPSPTQVLSELYRINRKLKMPETVAHRLVTLYRTLPTHAGAPLLIPPVAWWPRLVAHALIAQGVRTVIDKPIKVAHFWRPEPVNCAVSGAPNSDHLRCLGLDIDTPRLSKRKALRYLQGMFDSGLWEMGLGAKYRGGRIHVGLITGHQRTW